jgi:hypothetical protein
MRDNDGISTHPGAVWPGLLLLCLCFVCLFPAAVFQNHAIIPADILFRYHPWQWEFPDTLTLTEPVNWILFDEILEFYPWRELLRNSLLQGRIPLWDPTAFCGYPFAGLFQNAMLYPPDRLLDIFSLRFFTILRAFFHILAAGAGMGLYLRHHRMRTPAVTFGVTAFGLCGFMIVWLGHPHAKVAAWMPLLFLGMDLLHRSHLRAVPAAALAMSLSLLAGHVQTALHTISAALLYFSAGFLIRGRKQRILPAITALAVTLLISLLTAGGMLLPFSEYLFQSVAYATRSGGVIIQGWLDPILGWTILMPKLFGSSSDGNYGYPGFNSAELGGLFSGVTTLVLALTALIALRRKPLVRLHFCLVLLSGLTVFGVPPVYNLVTSLPGFIMSYNFRLSLVASFSLIVLGAHTVNALCGAPDITVSRLMNRVSIGLMILIAAGVSFLHYVVSSVPLAHPFRSAVSAVSVLMVLYLVNRFYGRRNPRVLHVLLPLALAVELVRFGFGFNPTHPASLLDTWPESRPVVSVGASGAPFRTLPIGQTYPPHLCALMNMHDIRGNDAMTPLVTEQYIALFSPDMKREYSLPALRLMWLHTWRSPLVDALNVKYVLFPVAELEIPPGDLVPVQTAGGVHIFSNPRYLERAFLVHQWTAYGNDDEIFNHLRNPGIDLSLTGYVTDHVPPAPETFDASENTVTFNRYDKHRIDLETFSHSPALLVLSDTYYPGWTVRTNGREETCVRVNHMMRGVFVPPGHNRVQFRYEPVSWRLGLFLTFLGCYLFLLGFVLFSCHNGGSTVHRIGHV